MFRLCQKFFGRVVKTAINVSSGTLWGKFRSKKITIIIFEHWTENISAFWPKFLDRVVKTAFYVSMGTVRTFLKNVSFSSFWDIRLKKFRQGCQYCILRIRDIWKVFCWRKLNFLSFSETERKNLGLLAQFFWQGCQNCIIRDHRNVMRKKQNSRELFFISFSDIQRK